MAHKLARKRYPRRSSIFALGDRVRFTKTAFDAGLVTDDGKAPLFGTVMGYGRMVGLIRVQRDQRKTVDEYHSDFWELIPKRNRHHTLRRQRRSSEGK